MEAALLVGLGGALGAVCRFWVYSTVALEDLPVATVLVNVLGSFLAGLFVFAGVGTPAHQVAVVGFCGSFTTFSSLAVETVQLWERGDRGLALTHAGGTLVGALAGIGLAWTVVSLLA